MPSPERGQPEQFPEQEPTPYYHAARFTSAEPAGAAYFEIQEMVFATPDADLSVYRFLLDRISHVAVLGQRPREEIEQEVQRILAGGEPVSLPPVVVAALLERRKAAMQPGTLWWEGHYQQDE